MATTLPMLGAISPRAAAGLRPICVQCCASEWTSAQECMDRTSATSPNCAPSLGIKPMGQSIPLTMVGLKFDGVTPFTTFRSNISVGLGAPAIKMKMQFFALFCVVTVPWLSTSALATLPTRYEPTTPAPMMSKNRRRVKCGRLKNVRCGCGLRSTNLLNRSRSDMALISSVFGSVIENEIFFVVQRPEQVLKFLPARTVGAHICHGRRHLGVGRIAGQDIHEQHLHGLVIWESRPFRQKTSLRRPRYLNAARNEVFIH